MADRNINFNALVPELMCRDVADSLAFCRDVLGFVRLYGRNDPPVTCLERETSQIMLDQTEPDGCLLRLCQDLGERSLGDPSATGRIVS